MIDYPEKTTSELIDLLFKEEDRVKRRHIEELIGRGEEAAAPLRGILKDEDYWYEGQDGNYWILVHAIIILSAMRDEKAFPDLIEIVPHAYFSNHDDAAEILPAALAQYGEKAVEPFIKFISDHRGAHHDNQDYSSCRNTVSGALTRIAHEHAAVRDRVTDFICGNFTDPQEDDAVFLSFSSAHPFALDEERGLNALRAAHQRGAIKQEIVGELDDFVELLDEPDYDAFFDLERDLFGFYEPKAIEERQRQRAEKKEEALYPKMGGWKTVPAGDTVPKVSTIVGSEKIGRNDPCPCGSGRKYKKCCGPA